MYFYRRAIPGLAIYSYLIGDEASKTCAVIDPVRDIEDYIRVAENEGFEITHVFETHVHADYICGSLELKTRLGGKPQICCSGLGGEEWIPKYADHIVKDGEKVQVGSLQFKVIHTPGHTPEHIMWELVENDGRKTLFTGDFLFVGDVGRPDLLGDKAREKLAHQLYESVFQILKPISDEVEYFPTHGSGSLCGKSLGKDPSSTLGKERTYNPSLEEKPEQEWIAELMQDMPPAPKYFPRMKKINVEGAKVIGSTRPGKTSLTTEQVNEFMASGAQLVDARKERHYDESHILNSLSIPFSPMFSTWAGWFLSSDRPIIIRIDAGQDVIPIIDSLLRVGFDNIAGYFNEVWSGETRSLPFATPLEVNDQLKDGNTHILDVRTEGEFNRGHIEGAQNIHAGLVPENIHLIPKDKTIAIICGSGYRSTTACSLLEQQGFKRLINIRGGMIAWIKDGLPIIS